MWNKFWITFAVVSMKYKKILPKNKIKLFNNQFNEIAFVIIFKILFLSFLSRIFFRYKIIIILIIETIVNNIPNFKKLWFNNINTNIGHKFKVNNHYIPSDANAILELLTFLFLINLI